MTSLPFDPIGIHGSRAQDRAEATQSEPSKIVWVGDNRANDPLSQLKERDESHFRAGKRRALIWPDLCLCDFLGCEVEYPQAET